jgi:hypothetical protein
MRTCFEVCDDELFAQRSYEVGNRDTDEILNRLVMATLGIFIHSLPRACSVKRNLGLLVKA